MKQLLSLLWSGTTQEIAAVAGALGAFLSGFLPGASGGGRIALTVAAGALSALAVVADALVKHSENVTAAQVTAARVHAQAAQTGAAGAAAAAQAASGLSSLLGSLPGAPVPSAPRSVP